MITEGRGNLLRADVEALVNTVNTVGVMGKGIALQFKRAYPAMFAAYAEAAKAGQVQLGSMHVWATEQLTGPQYVINFPTKGNWRSRSRIADIESGLEDLVRVVRDRGIRSIAVPPLGCGNGGLEWRVVEPMIRSALGTVDGLEVLLYSPAGAPPAGDMTSAGPKPGMTPGRAALILLMKRYAEHALANPSLIESQKLLYFLQVAGEPLALKYQKHRYGPYADNLRHVLHRVEGHYLRGFGDGSAPVHEAEPLEVLPGAEDVARPVLDEHPETAGRIDRVMDLAGGFETAFGLELLATVHWLASEQQPVAPDVDAVVRGVREWSPRKERLFTADHIRTAWTALHERGWLPLTVAT